MNPLWLLLFIPLFIFAGVFFRLEDERKQKEAAQAAERLDAWVNHCLKTGDWK